MKKAIAIAALVSSNAVAGNYATCLLEKMPGLQNDAAAAGARVVCLDKYPGGFDVIPQGGGLGFLSYKSGAECLMKKAGDTRSNLAARAILIACKKLYDKPKPFGAFDPASAR